MTDLKADTLFTVQGLVAVVTGGGTGIGLMIAQALEANGAIVYILGRRKEVLQNAASTAKHGNIRYFQADVTSKADLASAVEYIARESGHVNLVVANSGVAGPSVQGLPKDASLADMRNFFFNTDADEFNHTFAVNTTAVFYTVIAFLDLLDKGNKVGNVEQRSQVITVSSAGAYSKRPMSGYAYGSSKAAVIHMMKQFATSLAPHGIRCNVIAPGVFPSEMTENLIAKENLKENPWPKDFLPEQRVGDVKEMAGAVLFLTSRAGGYVNGNVLIMEGGVLSVIPSTY